MIESMDIEGMTNAQIKEELTAILPYIRLINSDHIAARGYTSIPDIDAKRLLHGWRLTQIYDYQRRLNEELRRREERKGQLKRNDREDRAGK